MESWNYFEADRFYSSKLRQRLTDKMIMRSAAAMATYVAQFSNDDDLKIVDFGSGPGHYLPAFTEAEVDVAFYRGVDFDSENIDFGNKFYANDDAVEFVQADMLTDISATLEGVNTVISANTLPHIPRVDSFLNVINQNKQVKLCVFRMLIGSECVQIKKHLSDTDFVNLFESGFQHNNIYSVSYLRKFYAESDWDLIVCDDIQDWSLEDEKPISSSVSDEFYLNRVSRRVSDMTFKGDIYMPWRFLVAKRK